MVSFITSWIGIFKNVIKLLHSHPEDLQPFVGYLRKIKFVNLEIKVVAEAPKMKIAQISNHTCWKV